MEGVFYPLVFPVPPVKCTRNPVSAAGFLDRLTPGSFEPGVSVSKKSSNGWAFSYLDGIINMGDERCWNAEKWIVVS